MPTILHSIIDPFRVSSIENWVHWFHPQDDLSRSSAAQVITFTTNITRTSQLLLAHWKGFTSDHPTGKSRPMFEETLIPKPILSTGLATSGKEFGGERYDCGSARPNGSFYVNIGLKCQTTNISGHKSSKLARISRNWWDTKSRSRPSASSIYIPYYSLLDKLYPYLLWGKPSRTKENPPKYGKR